MSSRLVFHVLPQGTNWKVRIEGSDEVIYKSINKEESVKKAIELAKMEPLAQVKFHKADGTIEEERTYGKDPRDIPG